MGFTDVHSECAPVSSPQFPFVLTREVSASVSLCSIWFSLTTSACLEASLTGISQSFWFFLSHNHCCLLHFSIFDLGCVNMSITSMSTLPVLWWFVTPITWSPRWDQLGTWQRHIYFSVSICFSASCFQDVGYSCEMLESSVQSHRYPEGDVWKANTSKSEV